MIVVSDARGQYKDAGIVSEQKFWRRYKAARQDALRRALGKSNVTDLGKGGETGRIRKEDLREPTFHHGRGNTITRVFPGNLAFEKGDVVPKPEGGGGGKGNDPSGEGRDSEDDFIFHMSEEELEKEFFADLGLPNLREKSKDDVKTTKNIRAGFTSSGPHANLSRTKSKQQKLGRTIAQSKPYNDRIMALLREEQDILSLYVDAETVDDIKAICSQKRKSWEPFGVKMKRQESINSALKNAVNAPFSEEHERRLKDIALDLREQKVQKNHKMMSWQDGDLRYRFSTAQPQPSSKAVMFCLMDVSASMTEEMKDLAKRYYMLLYKFLLYKYGSVDVVFIRHTDVAEEVNEKEFFYGKKSGGTTVSSGLKLMADIRESRYSGDEWNVYGAQCSDGDIFGAKDAADCNDILRNRILKNFQGFFYTETPSKSSGKRITPLWQVYSPIQQDHADNFWMGIIRDKKGIVAVFRELFKKNNINALSSPSEYAEVAYG